MKNAFTMLELVLVIVVVGILSMMVIPRFSDDNVREAADQLLSYIRYTQHLSIIDDQFVPNDQNWHKKRWQIQFAQCTPSGSGKWYFNIGRDTDNNGKIEKFSSATNPEDGKLFYIQNNCDLKKDESDIVLLSKKFGINNITFSSTCGNNQYISFDYNGRPLKSTGGANAFDYISSDCNITFNIGSKNFTITIVPETGYVFLSSINQ